MEGMKEMDKNVAAGAKEAIADVKVIHERLLVSFSYRCLKLSATSRVRSVAPYMLHAIRL